MGLHGQMVGGQQEGEQAESEGGAQLQVGIQGEGRRELHILRPGEPRTLCRQGDSLEEPGTP